MSTMLKGSKGKCIEDYLSGMSVLNEDFFALLVCVVVNNAGSDG